MERWYADRIGGMFTANAEAVADRALWQPSVGMAETRFTCKDQRPGSPSRMDIGKHGAEGISDGWSKPAHLKSIRTGLCPELNELNHCNASKQVFIGIVATLLGAPSAPYLHVHGVDRLFSPLCVAQPDDRRQFRFANVDALGAATQFRMWLNDTDGWWQNSAVCSKTNSFYMYDHEYAAPQVETSPKLIKFINELALLRGRNGVCPEMHAGAAAMADRIRKVDTANLQDVAALCKANGLSVTDRFVKALAQRARMFQRPIGEAYMQQPAKLTA